MIKLPNQNSCNEWRNQIKVLKEKHAEYLEVYREALSGADTKKQENIFLKCASVKKELKDLIMKLQNDMLPNLTPKQLQQLTTLEKRFIANRKRHPNLLWKKVQKALLWNTRHLDTLIKMEKSGGEPDVILSYDQHLLFADCSKEVPAGRRNVVYDFHSERSIKTKGLSCKGNALDMARRYEARLMTLEEYRILHTHGKFDKKSWTWLKLADGSFETLSVAEIGRYNEADEGPKFEWFDMTAQQTMGGFRCALDVVIPTPQEIAETRKILKIITTGSPNKDESS